MKKILLLIFTQISFLSIANDLSNVKKLVYSTTVLKVACDRTCSNRMGRRALRLTNNFRVNHNRRKLTWNQDIANLARNHSIDMARGKVPFGHSGFRRRVSRFPRRAKAAAENVGRTNIQNDPVKVIINGFKRSPGHRANMLGNYNFSGVGLFKNKAGVWYLTQMFALF